MSDLVTSPGRVPRRVSMGERPSASNTNASRDMLVSVQLLRNALFMTRPRAWAEAMLHSIVSIQSDYLVCRRVWRNETLGTEDVYVAKPVLLRGSVTSWNGITYTGYSPDGQSRTATRGGDSEDQMITPEYVAGDFIEVVVKRGLTGITEVDQQRGRPIDKNVDGRAWAKIPDAP